MYLDSNSDEAHSNMMWGVDISCFHNLICFTYCISMGDSISQCNVFGFWMGGELKFLFSIKSKNSALLSLLFFFRMEVFRHFSNCYPTTSSNYLLIVKQIRSGWLIIGRPKPNLYSTTKSHASACVMTLLKSWWNNQNNQFHKV